MAALAKLFRDCSGHLKDNPFLQLTHAKCMMYVLDPKRKGAKFLPKLFRFIYFLIPSWEKFFGESFKMLIPLFTNEKQNSAKIKNLYLQAIPEEHSKQEDELLHFKIRYTDSMSLSDIESAVSQKVGKRLIKLFGLQNGKKIILQDMNDIDENMTVIVQLVSIALENAM